MNGEARFLRDERFMRRCGISLSKEEKKNRMQAFHITFGPILLDMGFIKGRNSYWRIQGENYVQYVALKNARNLPAVHYIACGSEWGLARVAEGVMMPNVFTPAKWYSTPFSLEMTLQEYTGACKRAETIGYGRFDDVDDFYEGLALEYHRFSDEAIPLLSLHPTVKDYYTAHKEVISRYRCAGILACMMTQRYAEALSILDVMNPIIANDPVVSLFREQKNRLRDCLSTSDEVAMQQIVASCKTALHDDLTNISKKLAKQLL